MNIRLNGRRGSSAWRALEQTSLWADRRMVYRASSLPFCPRAFWLDRKLEPASERSYTNDVRFWRGNGIHNCLQFWLGQAGVLFGDWECPVCRQTPGPAYTVHDLLGPPPLCPQHNVTLRYREYELTYDGLSGHPDGLIPDPADPEPNTYSLLEIKSMQHHGFRGSSYPDWATIKKPYGPHIEQANAYACMIPRVKGFRITKVLVWYVSVERPTWQPKIFEFDPDERRFQKHLDVLHQIENQDLEGPPPVCDPDAQSPFCPFADPGYCSMRVADLARHLQERS